MTLRAQAVLTASNWPGVLSIGLWRLRSPMVAQTELLAVLETVEPQALRLLGGLFWIEVSEYIGRRPRLLGAILWLPIRACRETENPPRLWTGDTYNSRSLRSFRK